MIIKLLMTVGLLSQVPIISWVHYRHELDENVCDILKAILVAGIMYIWSAP